MTGHRILTPPQIKSCSLSLKSLLILPPSRLAFAWFPAPWSSGPLVPGPSVSWSLGPLVPRSSGPLLPRPLLPWSIGSLVSLFLGQLVGFFQQPPSWLSPSTWLSTSLKVKAGHHIFPENTALISITFRRKSSLGNWSPETVKSLAPNFTHGAAAPRLAHGPSVSSGGTYPLSGPSATWWSPARRGSMLTFYAEARGENCRISDATPRGCDPGE